jgi:REP element-mobilizing transposase RayT
MPRRARMYLPGLPYHVVQRGNNREACFIEPENYQFYLVLWEELSRRYGLSVHAYCLMTNPVHFLVTPERDSAVSNTMKVAGSRFCPIHQQEIPPHRNVVGRTPSSQPRAIGALPADLHALHRTQPGTGADGATAGGIPLVEL